MVEDFGTAFKGFLQQMAEQATVEEPYFHRRLREHFDADPARLTIVGEKFAELDHANVHLALEALTAGRAAEVIGISSEISSYSAITFAHLVAARPSARGGDAELGPVAYKNVTLDGGRVLACLKLGLILVKDGDTPLAILVTTEREAFGGQLVLEVLAAERAVAEQLLASLRAAIRKRNVYRGHVVSLSSERQQLRVRFHQLAPVAHDQIILPPGLLDRIERHTVGFAAHADRLRAAGRHLKRGLLLHGAPGTGKTLTAMYLAARMPERTVLLITGRAMGLIEQACAMARALEPATVVLEDVDLIAEERTQNTSCAPLLFELLNQMDGLADDADLLFVLTTNRPDLLEPALAARPGRIDQAIEVPLPDATCRGRLFDLYARGLTVRAPIDRYVERTAGASAAFIRELLRKAALFAADDGGELAIEDRHLDAAMHEMVIHGGELARSLLGGPPAA
jgi:hypothetical protein